MGSDDLRIGHRRSLRIRDESGESESIQISRRLGRHARRQGHDSGEGRGAGRGRVEIHAPRSGAVRGPGPSQGLRAARGVDGNRIGAVPREPAHGPGEELGRVRAGVHVQPNSVGEHGVGRSQRQHRLSGGRHHAAAAELVGPRAGARRRTLRVERVPADQRAAARAESAEGLFRDGEQLSVPAGLPVQGSAALHRGRSISRVADQRGARFRTSAHRRRHDAAAERQRVAAGPQHRAAASRSGFDSDPDSDTGEGT